jgi:Ni,Fe-hydrogenase maturation factor
MQEALETLNLPLKVMWIPCSNKAVHGEIKQGTIFIYDENKEDAIETFQHELYEYKFKEVTRLHMTMVNALLEVLQKEIYNRKESFFDSLPSLQRAIQSLKE